MTLCYVNNGGVQHLPRLTQRRGQYSDYWNKSGIPYILSHTLPEFHWNYNRKSRVNIISLSVILFGTILRNKSCLFIKHSPQILSHSYDIVIVSCDYIYCMSLNSNNKSANIWYLIFVTIIFKYLDWNCHYKKSINISVMYYIFSFLWESLS